MGVLSGWTVKVLFALLIGFVAGYFRVLAVETTEVARPAIRADAADYYLSAYNLVHEGIYSRSPGRLANPPRSVEPDAYRPPGLPLVIASFMHLWPKHDEIMKRILMVNVALGIGAAVATFFAAAAVLPLAGALATGLMVAASPHLVSVSVYILTETPGAFLVSILLAASAIGVPRNHRFACAYFFLLGVIVGCLSLFRPIFLAFAPFVALAFNGRREIVSALLFSCLGAACVVAPWFIRNAMNIPSTANDANLIATTILDGSYRGYLYQGNPSTFPYPRFVDPVFETARRNLGAALSEVWRKVMADPIGMTTWYVFEKPVYLLQWSNIDGVGDVFIYPVNSTPFRSDRIFSVIHDVYYYFHVIIVILAGIGCTLAWTHSTSLIRRSDKQHVLRLASLLVVFLIVAHVPFFVATRYALPVFPALYLLSITAIVIIARALVRRLQRIAKVAT